MSEISDEHDPDLQQQIQSLTTQIASDPYDFHAYSDLITIHRNMGNLPEVTQLREDL